MAFLIFLPEGGWPLLATLDLRLVPGLALFSPRRTGRSRFNLLKSRGLRRFQIGFVWRFFRFLDVLSVNVRIRPCHRFAAVACYAATQAHPVLVIRPASATCHSPVATRHSSGGTRWTRVVRFPGLPVPFRTSLGHPIQRGPSLSACRLRTSPALQCRGLDDPELGLFCINRPKSIRR